MTLSVTNNREEEGRRHAWQREAEAIGKLVGKRKRGRGVGREGASTSPNTEGGNDGGQWDKREGGKGNGGGLGGLGTWRSVSLPRDRGHVIGHTWGWNPGTLSCKFTAFTEFLWWWRSMGGGVGCLSCMLSMFICVGVGSSIPQAKCAPEAHPEVLYSLLSAMNFLWVARFCVATRRPWPSS